MYTVDNVFIIRPAGDFIMLVSLRDLLYIRSGEKAWAGSQIQMGEMRALCLLFASADNSSGYVQLLDTSFVTCIHGYFKE